METFFPVLVVEMGQLLDYRKKILRNLRVCSQAPFLQNSAHFVSMERFLETICVDHRTSEHHHIVRSIQARCSG